MDRQAEKGGSMESNVVSKSNDRVLFFKMTSVSHITKYFRQLMNPYIISYNYVQYSYSRTKVDPTNASRGRPNVH